MTPKSWKPDFVLLTFFILCSGFSLEYTFVTPFKSLFSRHPVFIQAPSSWLEPGAGLEYAMSEPVWQGIQLLKENKISRFSISPSWKKDITHFERLLEGSFPLVFDPDAREVLVMDGIQLENRHCEEMAQKSRVTLVRCS